MLQRQWPRLPVSLILNTPFPAVHTYYCRIIAPERNKKGKPTSVSLSLSDIQSLYPAHGISDAVVDLYIRYAFIYSHKAHT